jgi:DEAD/DEAH box helicase domain-containing protein
LGIDIGALDAALTVGYPGTMASLWQQWGRAGRGKGCSVSVFIAGNDALEQFFITNPDQLLAREVEAATVDFANPFIHQRHLEAAAYEGPLLIDDQHFFGAAFPEALHRGQAEGSLRHKNDAWYYSGHDFPAGGISLRSAGGEQFTIVEEDTGDIIGTEGAETAFSALHPGAVYLHMGDTYLVRHLDLEARLALVRPFWDTYHTQARRESDTRIVREHMRNGSGRVTLHLGEIVVTSRVVAFQKKRLGSDEVLGTEELDMPTQEFATESMWFTIPLELIGEQMELVRLPGAIHAIEHALIALLPLYAMCDRWDIGGLSTPVHPQTELPTIFVYDGHAGGVGISRQGFDRFTEWAANARALIRDCPCERGCPSCIQSPKCGNLNEPLDKEIALRLLEAML